MESFLKEGLGRGERDRGGREGGEEEVLVINLEYVNAELFPGMVQVDPSAGKSSRLKVD